MRRWVLTLLACAGLSLTGCTPEVEAECAVDEDCPSHTPFCIEAGVCSRFKSGIGDADTERAEDADLFMTSDVSVEIDASDAEGFDAALSDAELPDSEIPDSEIPDSEPSDGEAPDEGMVDAETPDVGAPDGDVEDMMMPDVEVPDAEVPDAEVPDAEVMFPPECERVPEEELERFELPCVMGLGECEYRGVWICNGSETLFCDADGREVSEPVPEQCDGADNDCDGVIDEGGFGPCFDAPFGQCEIEGTRICVEEAFRCEPLDPPPHPFGNEACDGVDNDCDGRTDEGFPGIGDTCQLQVQACEYSGVLACDAEGNAFCLTHVPPEAHITDEICDDQDNDCDGLVDEELADQPCLIGEGICVRRGTTICNAEGMECFTEIPVVLPQDEVCDGRDNDCDGSVDEQAVELCADVVPMPNMQQVCVGGECITQCIPGYINDDEGGCVRGCDASALIPGALISDVVLADVSELRVTGNAQQTLVAWFEGGELKYWLGVAGEGGLGPFTISAPPGRRFDDLDVAMVGTRPVIAIAENLIGGADRLGRLKVWAPTANVPEPAPISAEANAPVTAVTVGEVQVADPNNADVPLDHQGLVLGQVFDFGGRNADIVRLRFDASAPVLTAEDLVPMLLSVPPPVGTGSPMAAFVGRLVGLRLVTVGAPQIGGASLNYFWRDADGGGGQVLAPPELTQILLESVAPASDLSIWSVAGQENVDPLVTYRGESGHLYTLRLFDADISLAGPFQGPDEVIGRPQIFSSAVGPIQLYATRTVDVSALNLRFLQPNLDELGVATLISTVGSNFQSAGAFIGADTLRMVWTSPLDVPVNGATGQIRLGQMICE